MCKQLWSSFLDDPEVTTCAAVSEAFLNKRSDPDAHGEAWHTESEAWDTTLQLEPHSRPHSRLCLVLGVDMPPLIPAQKAQSLVSYPDLQSADLQEYP